MTNPKWYKESDQITSSTPGYSLNSSTGALTFTASPVDRDEIRNIIYTFKCDVNVGGKVETIERSISVLVHEGGENSYWGQIDAPRGTVLGEVIEGNGSTSTNSFVTLKASLWCGATSIDKSQFTVEWYKTAGYFNSSTGQYEDMKISDTTNTYALQDNGKTLVVYRDGVDSMAHFECRFFCNGVHVETEGIQVVDNADMYFISVSGDKNVYTDSNTQVQLVAGVYKHGNNTLVSASSWNAVVTDSERMGEYENTDDHTFYQITRQSDGTGLFKMNESNMLVPNTGSDKAVKPWIICGASQAQDTSTATASQATKCDVVVQFIATV